MKSFIKLSFLIILLLAVFNTGLSDAYAKDAKGTDSANLIEAYHTHLNATPYLGVSDPITTCANLNAFYNLQDPCNIDVHYKEVSKDGSYSELTIQIEYPCEMVGIGDIIKSIKDLFF